MSNIVPARPLAQTVHELVAPSTYDLQRLGGNDTSGLTWIVCKSRGGTGASTAASILLYAAGAEPGLYIQFGGVKGYGYRAHDAHMRDHIAANSDDRMIARCLDIRLAAPEQFAVIDVDEAHLGAAMELSAMLLQLKLPAAILYLADHHELEPTFVKAVVNAGLRSPLIFNRPAGLSDHPPAFPVVPALTGLIAEYFYDNHLPIGDAVHQCPDLGSVLVFGRRVQEFVRRLQDHA